MSAHRSPKGLTRLAVGLLALLPAGVAPLCAQSIQGVVLDSITGAPVQQAAVAYEGAVGMVSVTTDAEGRFELTLDGDPPWTLEVQALGYQPRTVSVGSETVSHELRIPLSGAPFELEGVTAGAAREEPNFKFGAYWVTNSGLVWPGRGREHCVFLMIDSVVVKDYHLLDRDVIRRYERANLWAGSPSAYGARLGLDRKYIADPRLRHDAWPCGVYKVLKHRFWDRLRALPDPAIPEGQPVALVEASTVSLPPLPECPEAVAVSKRGEVAAVSGDESQVEVLDPDGHPRRSIPTDRRPDAAPCSIRVGWRSDTLWVSDASRTRLSLVPPTGPPVVREAMGAPADPPWVVPDRPLPSSPLAMDLPVPVPVAGGRWLWTYPAPDPPTPPLPPEDPPGRILMVLNDEWALDHVLEVLRPGAAPVDVVLGSQPVLGTQPFGDHPLYQVSPDGTHVTIVQREHQMAAWMTVYRVTRIGLDGDTLFHTERRAMMVRMTDEAFDSTVAELARRPGAVAAFPGPAEGRETLLQEMVYRPPFHPAITALMVGYDGTTWLRWPDARTGRVRWEVLDGHGEALRTLEADRRLTLIAADGDQVWGRLPDDDGRGVRLVRFRVGPAEGG